MYDGKSLCRLLREAGFEGFSVMPPGRTMIPDPEPLNLREREDKSVYVEGIKPKKNSNETFEKTFQILRYYSTRC